MKKRILSIVLVLAMVISMVPVAFASETQPENANGFHVDVNENGKIDYISLGESMTNGYGTEGYYPEYDFAEHGYLAGNVIDRMGILDPLTDFQAILCNGGTSTVFDLASAETYNFAANGKSNTFGLHRTEATTYASEFATYLKSVYGTDNVVWDQWAMSGQRPEDFYWLMQENWTKGMDSGHDKDHLLFSKNVEGELAYNGDAYTTNIWKNGNDTEGKVSRFLSAKYGRYSQKLIGSFVDYTQWGFGPEGDLSGLGLDMQYVYEPGNAVAVGESDHVWDYTASNGQVRKFRYASQEAEDELAKFRDEYRKAIADADIISVNLGTHSFSSVVSSRMLDLFAGGSDWFNDSPDADGNVNWADDDAPVMAGRATMEQLLTFFPEYESIYRNIQAILDEYLGEEVKGIIGEEKFDAVVDLYGYATLSFLITYDRSLEVIRDLNPYAEIIVMGMSNFQEGLKFDMGNGQVVDFGGLFGKLVDFTNAYRAGWVEDSQESIYVPPVENMDLLIDEFSRGEANVVYLARIIRNMAYYWEFNSPQINEMLGNWDNDVYKQISAISHLYGKTDPVRPVTTTQTEEQLALLDKVIAVLEDIAATKTYDGAAAIKMFGEGGSIDMAGATAKIETGVELNDTEKAAIHLWIRCFMAEGIGCHPSVKGHKDLGAQMIECYKEGLTGEDYINSEVPGAFTAEKIYDFLKENKYIDDAVINAIMDLVAEKIIDGELSDAEMSDIAKGVYSVLMLNQEEAEDRIAILVGIYGILKADGYLKAYAKELDALEKIVALDELDKVTPEQTFAIVNALFEAIVDGEVDKDEILYLAKFIY
ncbi:MAG: hypothetical protein IKT45_03150, partial [Lachnospiraceae bacterium]|nr:hypothetical protein [Lachnospiraceae bacterium]